MTFNVCSQFIYDQQCIKIVRIQYFLWSVFLCIRNEHRQETAQETEEIN